MKVLTFISSLSLNGGGPSRSVPMLVKGLSEVGVDITLMTIRSEDMNTHALDDCSALFKVFENNFTYKDLEDFVLQNQFDLIQLQSMWDLSYHKLACIAVKHKIPYIITPRGMLEPWSLNQKRWKKRLALWLYQMKDLQRAACIFTTAEMEAMHVRDLGVRGPISVIPNGISTEGYSCRTSMQGVKKQILFLSRIHEKKGIELLIDAFYFLYPQFQDWKVIIVGNGEAEYIDSLKQRVARYGLSEVVQIMPPVFGDEKIRLYQQSSLFCLPSYSENFGMVIAEAMSCGVPALTTTGTPWELLNGHVATMGASLEVLGCNRRTGWCIELNQENLVKALSEAMSLSPEVLYQMGQKGSELISRNFNYRSVAMKTVRLYEWILKGGEKPDFIYE